MTEKTHYKRVEVKNIESVTLTVEAEVFAADDEEASRRMIRAIMGYAQFFEEVEW